MAQRAQELFSEDDDTEAFFKSGGQDAPEQEEEQPVEEEAEESSSREQEEPEAEAEPDADTGEDEEKDETVEEEAKRRQVPLAALREERQRRKEIQEELREARRKQFQMEQAWQQVQQRLNQQHQPQAAQQPQQQPQEEQPPSYDEDPAGYLRWQQNQLQKKLDELDQWKNYQSQSYAQNDQQQRFAAVVSDYENQFRNKAPDYDDAVQFLKQRRDQELRGWGVVDPQQRQNIVNQEVMFLANAALQNGDSPAERAYEMAKTWGWQSPQARQAAQEQEEQANQEQERQQQVKQNTKKMGTLKKGSQASKSLSKSKGDAPVNLTLETLADIDDPQEFDKQWEKMFGKSPII